MAFAARDGKQFGNRQRAARYDDEHSGATQEGSDASPDDAVAQHGPANNIQITKGNGSHHVVAKHPDGHTSRSSHATAGEAIDAARMVSGADDADADGSTDPSEQEAPPAPAMSGSKTSTRIPGV